MSAAAVRCKIPTGDDWWYQCIAFGSAPAGDKGPLDEEPQITYLEAIIRLNNDRPPKDNRIGAVGPGRAKGQRLLLGKNK